MFKRKIKAVLKKQSTIKEKSDKPDKPTNGVSETVEEKLVKPSAAKSADKASRPADEKPRFTKSSLKSVDKTPKTEDKTSNDKAPEKPALRSVRTIDGDKSKDKSVTIVDKKSLEKNSTSKTNNTVANGKTPNDKSVTNSTSKTTETKPVLKKTETTKVEEKDDSKMATKPPIEKPPTKLPPRKPSLVKQPSKDEPVKKWRDPLHERVKENIDKTLNEVPKGHTLKKNESLRTVFLYVASILGVTAGAHRLWSHRAYKAKWPLQLILMIFQTLSLQYSVLNWVRDHRNRMHHKYVDTDADPHNATRGFFFSHIGWLMMEKHPEYERKVKGLDLSDVENNPILRFQKTYYAILVSLICFILPTAIPVYIWNETWTNALLIAVFLRIACSANSTGLINSAAHKWGYRRYDKNMLASEFMLVSLLMLGEGFHNYRHAFPWDYKARELSGEMLNITTTFIDFFARTGWAYDLKTISDDIIRKRVMRIGDGSHHISRCGDKDQRNEYKDYLKPDAAIIINTKDN